LAVQDRAEIKQQLPALAAGLVGAESACLVAREGDDLVVLSSWPEARSSRKLGVTDDVAALAFKLDQPVLWQRDSGEPLTLPYASAMALPLAVKDQPEMALSLYRQEPFTPDDRDQMTLLLDVLPALWERVGSEDHHQLAAYQAELRQAEFKMNQLKEQLSQGEKLKAEFVATMSHELRTPLNVVLGFGSLLADEAFGELNPDQSEACQKIMESSERLATLINDLLDWSRLEASTLEFNMAQVDVARLAHDVIEDMRPLADRKELQLQLEIEGTLPTIKADPDRIEQVLKHLLDNAVKFTPNGGSVGLRAWHLPENDAIGIDVWDTGIGIPPDAMHKLFTRFYQVDSSNTRLYGGTGIGLSLVKELVHRHGGEVTVDSKVNKGSTFHVLLPIAGPPEGYEMESRLVDAPQVLEDDELVG
jgi:signal transduction histidine kinase